MPASLNYAISTVAVLAVLGHLTAVAQAKGWRGIVPLQSSRADVERVLGPSQMDRGDTVVYLNGDDRVSVEYSPRRCGVRSSFWDVPRDIVITIHVTPKLLFWKDLKLDLTHYKRINDEELPYIFRYTNDQEGITYEVDANTGHVTFAEYFPTTEDVELKCPSSSQCRRTLHRK